MHVLKLAATRPGGREAWGNGCFHESSCQNVKRLILNYCITCRLNEVNPFDYLTALQRNAAAVKASPADWLPWNYTQADPKSVPG
jgi:hypothetical protein